MRAQANLTKASEGLSDSMSRLSSGLRVRSAADDAAEAEAIVKVFGSETPIVTSTKGATGHTLGAAGAIEAIAVLLAIQNKQIPQTHGTSAVDPELAQIDLVTDEPRDWSPGPSLSNSFGFGGHNGTLVIGPSS